MGAWFAPSVANLFMDMWETEQIFQHRPPELKMYCRFIDYIFFIWEGDTISVEEFQQKLNHSNRGIELMWHTSSQKIAFLDLEIEIDNNHLATSIHFKPTDRLDH